MGRTDFENFIQRKREEKAPFELDAKKELREWLGRLDELYKTITGFVGPYLEAGSARIEYRDIQLNEEFSGPYAAKQLFLIIGNSTIIFRPVGTMLIGAKGRVDVQGPRGLARLVLVNKSVANARQMIRVTTVPPGAEATAAIPEAGYKEIEWVWKIATPAPELKFIDLNDDGFFDMVLRVADA